MRFTIRKLQQRNFGFVWGIWDEERERFVPGCEFSGRRAALPQLSVLNGTPMSETMNLGEILYGIGRQ